jgi:N-acetyl-gamma-glutamyl-phosphate/LysW-gamma-L-alpha-aminoadipyl-6-phosphate reductase
LRVVKEQRGLYRVPEPKVLAGSNYADLGFDLDESNGHIVSICAIDNLMKGAAGTAVQCVNLMLGFDETLGLEFSGLHPI